MNKEQLHDEYRLSFQSEPYRRTRRRVVSTRYSDHYAKWLEEKVVALTSSKENGLKPFSFRSLSDDEQVGYTRLAGQAMQALLPNSSVLELGPARCAEIAIASFNMAEAMMIEDKKRTGI